MANLDRALALAAEGYAIFPSLSKVPLLKAPNEAASTDPETIAKWFSLGEAVPALPCQRNGLVIIDCDVKRGINGIATWKSWCADSGLSLDDVFSVATPSGGRHYYYSDASGLIGNRPLGPGVDVRGVGGFAVAYGPVPRVLAALPEAIAAHLRDGKAHSRTTPAAVGSTAVQPSDRSYGMAALRRTAEHLAAVTSGRNHALNVAANAMGELIGNGCLDEEAVVKALSWACAQNGYTAKDGEEERDKTMFSGLGSGKARPRPLPSAMAQEGNTLQQSMTQSKPAAVVTMPSAKRSVKLLRMDGVEEAEVEWLWDQYLPIGCLTILAGPGGLGKSTIAYSFAATVSKGMLWPDGTRARSAGNVLIWSSEDSAAHVIKPRLLAMNADVTRIGMLDQTEEANGQLRSFDPSQDMEELKVAVNAIGGVSLIVIDPIVSAVVGDMHKANDVRRSLQPIMDFAEEQRCAVIGITHFAKNKTGHNVTERVLGSQAFTAAARMVLATAKDESTGERVFLKAKTNISRDGSGFRYSIQETTIQPKGIRTTLLKWGEKIEGSAQEIMNSVQQTGEDKNSKLAEAKRWLEDALRNGPKPANALMHDAKAECEIAEKTLRRAKDALGIEVQKGGFQGQWLWSLPSLSPSH